MSTSTTSVGARSEVATMRPIEPAAERQSYYRRFDPANRADENRVALDPDASAPTPPERIDAVVNSAAGTVEVARLIDVVASVADDAEAHALDVTA